MTHLPRQTTSSSSPRPVLPYSNLTATQRPDACVESSGAPSDTPTHVTAQPVSLTKRSTQHTAVNVCIRPLELELPNFPDAGQPLLPTAPRIRTVLGRDCFGILGHNAPCFVVAASLVASPRDAPVRRGAILLVAPHLAMLPVSFPRPLPLPAK